MRLKIHIFRTIKVRTEDLKAIVGVTPKAKDERETMAENEATDTLIRQQFGPHMAPTFKIFWSKAPGFKTTLCGMECLSFDVKMEQIPQSGVIQHDPIDPNDIHRVDGALISELSRLGLFVDPKEIEWRTWYERK